MLAIHRPSGRRAIELPAAGNEIAPSARPPLLDVELFGDREPLEERGGFIRESPQPQVADRLPVVLDRSIQLEVEHQCSSEPSEASTFFSPAVIATGKRFCLGGSGQLKA